MADEISTGELARRLDEILRNVQRLPTREEFTSEQRLTEHRFTEIENDIKELQRRIEDREKTGGANVRQAIYAGLIPTALFLVTILLQLKGGGA